VKRLAALLLVLVPLTSFAQDRASSHPYFDNKYFASVGLFKPDRKVRLGLDASVDIPDPGPAMHVDFSETLDVESSDETFSAEIGWRFGEKWQLRGQYFQVDDKNRASLDEDVEWGDYVFNAGTSVGAGSDIQITRLFFGRTFWLTENREFGLGLGGHLLDLSAYVNGNATINGVDVGCVQERASVTAPLPNIGGWFMRSWSERWAARVRLDWLAADVGRYDGHIINASASVGYAIGDHFGMALAYNYFEIDLGIDDPDWRGSARSRYEGPYLSLTGYW
jgi:hypothetical protein